jgi:hypothetical protein
LRDTLFARNSTLVEFIDHAVLEQIRAFDLFW